MVQPICYNINEGIFMKDKKQLILLILKILENESDLNHPLRQTDIARIISDVLPCDRKTVGRNIKFLIKSGYPIVKTGKGFYLNGKKLSLEEKDFVIRCIRSSQEKSDAEKEEIIQKLNEIFIKIFRENKSK